MEGSSPGLLKEFPLHLCGNSGMLLKELRVLKFLSQDTKPRVSLDTTRN